MTNMATMEETLVMYLLRGKSEAALQTAETCEAVKYGV